ncbi:hypothetical protein L915_04244 [Phytophthora nicotianae]|uniref:Uncharacterized protein n=1 Tax=Phytophthora nicotianae TaxID=4792 RepID=W2HCU2_PHYNI|nr:hypothetical protein L915_04244 [Phytophthora nicotianae]
MKEEPTAVPTEPEDTEVTRQASPTLPATSQRSNVASPSSRSPSPPADASPQAPTSYELEMQLLFGSDDDEDAPSGSQASREPAGLISPYRSSSDEDTPSPTKPTRVAPAMVLTTVMELVEMILKTTNLRSIFLLVILLVIKIFRCRPTFLEHPLLSRVLLPVFRRLPSRELPEAPNNLLRSPIPRPVKPRPRRLKLHLHCQEFSRVQRLLVVTIRLRGLH